MRTDYGTTGYTQWFFFRISNFKRGQRYKLNIMNMMKPNYMYNQGMKILCYPIDAFNKDLKLGWRRDGENIAYYKNCIQRRTGFNYYTLTFTINSISKSMYISSDYPYRYTDLMNFINEICTEKNKDRIRHATLCKTLAGNNCPLLTLTNFSSSADKIARRRAIILTGRVHPG